MKAIFAFLTIAACWAQQPEFEVATIKPSPPPEMGKFMIGTRGGPGTDDPGRFACIFCSVKMMLGIAYDVRQFQISGPPTLDSEHFEVVAKVPQGTTKEQFRVMLQNLLAERFQVKLHHESKETQLYQLVVAKGGPKLQESGPPPEGAPQAPPPPGPMRTDKDGYPMLPQGGRGGIMVTNGARARMRGSQETMQQLATRLSNMVGKPVVDATGLTGKYDYTLSFASEMKGGMMAGLPPPPPGGDGGGPGPAAAPDDSAPTIYTALQEQLGLRLEQKKGPVDMLVIDHVEKVPTEN